MKVGKIKLTGFGPLIIGKKRFAEEQAHVESGRTKFGPLVLGTKGAINGTNTPQPGSEPITSGMSVSAMADTLEKNPHYLAAFVNQEFARPATQIRRTALNLFIEVAPIAFEKNSIARDEVVERCQAWLTKGKDTTATAAPKETGSAKFVRGTAAPKNLGPSATAAAVRAQEQARELAEAMERAAGG